MHMADALLSPAVGGTFWGLSSLAVMRSSWKVRWEMDSSRLPLMGVMGAFIFAAQMVNFAIPGTGSSGHLGGGLLLAVLLGPDAALLAMASVLVVQALVFADGGLLALGCNIFNMGVIPAFVAYPLVYRPLAGNQRWKRSLGIVLGALLGLQMGALAVVLETVLSGRSELPFRAFLLAMQPIHLAIGVVEGLATVGLLAFLHRMRPEILEEGSDRAPLKGALLVGCLALLCGGVLAWCASKRPDGLEWATQRVAREAAPGPETQVHHRLAQAQRETALMPDYTLHGQETRAATSMAGVLGGGLTLGVLAGISGLMVLWRKRQRT